MVELLITYMVELAKEGVKPSVGWEEGRVTVAKMPFAHLEYDHYSDDDYDYDVNINILPPCLLCSHPQPVAQVVGEDSYSVQLPAIIISIIITVIITFIIIISKQLRGQLILRAVA